MSHRGRRLRRSRWSRSCAAAPTTCPRSSFWAPAVPPPASSTRRRCSTILPKRRDPRRLRGVGDRGHGLRRPHEGQEERGVRAQRRRHRDLRGPLPLPASRATPRWAGPPAGGVCPSGTCTTGRRPRRTFPIIDGERVTLPGDRAQLSADGRILLLGRDSLVVNTGGEKVFVEEVEDVVRRHPDVADALVVGRPSDRFGQEVVAVVAPAEGATIDPREHPRVRAGGDRPFQGAAGRGRRRRRPPPRQRQARLRLGQGGGADGGGCDRRRAAGPEPGRPIGAACVRPLRPRARAPRSIRRGVRRLSSSRARPGS